ncbi:MAG: DoxX family protein [Caulobacteraceae bacterium]|nr:DoxX family protein [Caulobacteraceae bacterium]
MTREVFFTLETAVALTGALVFARAAAFKLRDVEAFADALAAYRILPIGLVEVTARALPVAEIVCALALLAPPTCAAGEVAAAALLVVFALAMGVNLLRGRREIDCGCGDPSRRHPLAWSFVVRNLAFAAALGSSALAPARSGSLVEWAVGAAAAAGLMLLMLCHETFSALPAREGRGAPPLLRLGDPA